MTDTDRRTFLTALGTTLTGLASLRGTTVEQARKALEAPPAAPLRQPPERDEPHDGRSFVFDAALDYLAAGRLNLHEAQFKAALVLRGSSIPRQPWKRDVRAFAWPALVEDWADVDDSESVTFRNVRADGTPIIGVVACWLDEQTRTLRPLLFTSSGSFPIKPTGGDITVIWPKGLLTITT